MKLPRRPISSSDRIQDRFYVITMEFLSLSRRCSSARNVPSSEERGETDVFAGYHQPYEDKSEVNRRFAAFILDILNRGDLKKVLLNGDT